MVERVKAWQCIGCGRIEAPQTCVGVCQYGKIEMVYAGEHEEAMAKLRAQSERFEALARRIAGITPRAGECERTWKALQEDARRLLNELEAAEQK